MKWLRYLVLLLCTQTIADSNSMTFSLPSAGYSSGTDSIKAGDLDCKNSIGGTTNFELGMTGIINNAVTPLIGKEGENPQTKDIFLLKKCRNSWVFSLSGTQSKQLKTFCCI